MLRVVTLAACAGLSCVAFAREDSSFAGTLRNASSINNHRSLAALGEACSSPSQCDGPGEQTCSSGKCVCNTGYYESDATTCTIVPVGYVPSAMSDGGTCPASSPSKNWSGITSSADGMKMAATANYGGSIYYSSD